MELSAISLSRVIPGVFADQPDVVAASGVWGKDIELRRGECCMIEAASGAGKSSLCSFIYGLRADYEGAILFDGADIRSFSASRWSRIRRDCIAYLPQDMMIFPELTAMENIMLKNSLTRHLTDKEIIDMLTLLGIDDKAHAQAAKLSVGQQQRVAFVRALCQPFSFIILDEPVSHLDPANNRIMASIVQEHARRQGAGIVVTSVGNPLAIDAPSKIVRL